MTIANYTGNDVQTSGPDRHVRVTLDGREAWARAWLPNDATAVLLLGLAPRVTVLGWGNTAGPEWHALDAATRAALLTTLDADAAEWRASWGVANGAKGTAQTLTAARDADAAEWRASWGVANGAKGTAQTLTAARDAARKAYGPRARGARVKLYVGDALVYEEVLDDTKWRDLRRGEF